MAIVVFGGAGFVGLNIVEALLAKGEDVTVFDASDMPSSAIKAFALLPGRLATIQGDVCNFANVAGVLSGDIDAVVYGAAVTAGLERDRESPEQTINVNLGGFLTILRASRDHGVRRVINLSSAGAYGEAAFGNETLEESTPPDPRSIYSITKYSSERVGDRMAEVWGLDVVSVRLSAVFGRWERHTSVRDTPSPQFQILQSALAGRPALMKRRDSRDWIYAPDVAKAVIHLLDAPSLQHRLYNVSTGTSWSVADWGTELARLRPGFECRLAENAEEATIDLHAPRDRKQLSIERLSADTGFRPSYGMAQSAEDYDSWARGPGLDYI